MSRTGPVTNVDPPEGTAFTLTSANTTAPGAIPKCLNNFQAIGVTLAGNCGGAEFGRDQPATKPEAQFKRPSGQPSQLENQKVNLCLVRPPPSKPFGDLRLQTCSATADQNQEWEWYGVSSLRNPVTKKCIFDANVSGVLETDGACTPTIGNTFYQTYPGWLNAELAGKSMYIHVANAPIGSSSDMKQFLSISNNVLTASAGTTPQEWKLQNNPSSLGTLTANRSSSVWLFQTSDTTKFWLPQLSLTQFTSAPGLVNRNVQVNMASLVATRQGSNGLRTYSWVLIPAGAKGPDGTYPVKIAFPAFNRVLAWQPPPSSGGEGKIVLVTAYQVPADFVTTFNVMPLGDQSVQKLLCCVYRKSAGCELGGQTKTAFAGSQFCNTFMGTDLDAKGAPAELTGGGKCKPRNTTNNKCPAGTTVSEFAGWCCSGKDCGCVFSQTEFCGRPENVRAPVCSCIVGNQNPTVYTQLRSNAALQAINNAGGGVRCWLPACRGGAGYVPKGSDTDCNIGTICVTQVGNQEIKAAEAKLQQSGININVRTDENCSGPSGQPGTNSHTTTGTGSSIPDPGTTSSSSSSSSSTTVGGGLPSLSPTTKAVKIGTSSVNPTLIVVIVVVVVVFVIAVTAGVVAQKHKQQQRAAKMRANIGGGGDIELQPRVT